MQDLKRLLNRRRSEASSGSERGELVDFFHRAALPTWDAKKYGKLTFGRMLKKLQGLSVADLRYMRSIFNDTARRRGEVAAIKEMWWSINPKKHNSV